MSRLVLIVAVMLWAPSPRADTLATDLSSHLIAITTGFTGAEVVLFGATREVGDLVAVIRGPNTQAVVRQKGRVAGLWLNRDALRFNRVPSFYTLASTRPIEEIAPASVLAAQGIGIQYLDFEAEVAPLAETARMTEALIKEQRASGRFVDQGGRISVLPAGLFRATFGFPANIPTGGYRATVYLFQDGRVIAAETTPLLVSETGFGASVVDFADRAPLLYGLAAVLFAVAAGGIGWFAFGRR